MSRKRHYDIAKGIGIFLVVWGHSLIDFGHYIIYMFHMPLFFYLSGVFHRGGEIKELLKRRFVSLIVPLLVSLGLLFPLSVYFNVIPISFSVPHLRGICGPLWFLFSLFLVNIIYHPLLNLKPSYRLVVCAILSFGLGYVPYYYHIPNYGYIFTTFSVLIFYCLGNILARVAERKRSFYLSCGIFIVSSVGLILMYIVDWRILKQPANDLFDNIQNKYYLLFLFSAFLGIAMTISLSRILDRFDLPARLLAYVGECSLYIFLFHYAILYSAHHLLPFSGLLYEIILIMLSIAIGCMLRTPLNRFLPEVFK